MSKSVLSLVCAIAVGGAAFGAVLAHAAPSTQPATTQPATVDPKPVNAKCPVSGDDIDAKVTTVYSGKTYAFCCGDCVKTFKKDPAKYAAKAK